MRTVSFNNYDQMQTAYFDRIGSPRNDNWHLLVQTILVQHELFDPKTSENQRRRKFKHVMKVFNEHFLILLQNNFLIDQIKMKTFHVFIGTVFVTASFPRRGILEIST